MKTVVLINSDTNEFVKGFAKMFSTASNTYLTGSEIEMEDSAIPAIGDTIMLEFPNDEGQLLAKMYTVEKRVFDFLRDRTVLKIKNENV